MSSSCDPSPPVTGWLPADAPWTREAGDVATAFGVDPAVGLSPAEVADRLSDTVPTTCRTSPRGRWPPPCSGSCARP